MCIRDRSGSCANHNDAGFRIDDDRRGFTERRSLDDGGALLLETCRIRAASQIGGGTSGSSGSTLAARGAGTRGGLLVRTLDHCFTGTFGKDLVTFAKDVLQVLFQRLPEVVLRRALDGGAGVVAATSAGGTRSRTRAGRGNLRICLLYTSDAADE